VSGTGRQLQRSHQTPETRWPAFCGESSRTTVRQSSQPHYKVSEQARANRIFRASPTKLDIPSKPEQIGYSEQVRANWIFRASPSKLDIPSKPDQIGCSEQARANWIFRASPTKLDIPSKSDQIGCSEQVRANLLAAVYDIAYAVVGQLCNVQTKANHELGSKQGLSLAWPTQGHPVTL
jgi:hypothetical protein